MAKQAERTDRSRTVRGLDRMWRLGCAALPLALVALFASPAAGWPIPGMLVDEPKSPHERTYCKLSETGDYQEAPHAYIIERAGDVLRADGNVNWASGIQQFRQHMMDGSMYPDRAGPDLNIIVSIYLFPLPISSVTSASACAMRRAWITTTTPTPGRV